MGKVKVPAKNSKDNLEMSISEDELIRDLVSAKGHPVEIIAFGIAYTGTLADIDVEQGYAIVLDGDNRAVLEFERIEQFRLLRPSI